MKKKRKTPKHRSPYAAVLRLFKPKKIRNKKKHEKNNVKYSED